MGFITSPLEYSDAECQPHGPSRPIADDSLQRRTQPSSETDNQGDPAVSRLVVDRATGKDSAQGTQDDIAVDPLTSPEPSARR